jgi:hypothetical protein
MSGLKKLANVAKVGTLGTIGIGTAGQLGGAYISSRHQSKEAGRDRAMQYEFAKNAIQWKAEDARKAGLHPLAALGAQTISAQPVHTGADPIGSAVSGISERFTDAALQNAVQNNRGIELDNRFKLLRNKNQELMNQIAKNEALYGKPGSSPENPLPATTYFRTPDGKIIAAANQELAEGGEGTVGSKYFAYENIRRMFLNRPRKFIQKGQKGVYRNKEKPSRVKNRNYFTVEDY